MTKHRNSFIPCFLDQAYQMLLGKEEGKWGWFLVPVAEATEPGH